MKRHIRLVKREGEKIGGVAMEEEMLLMHWR